MGTKSPFQHAASMVAKVEGKKSQVKIGDVREIFKVMVRLERECTDNGEQGPITILAKAAAKKK